MGHNWFSSLLLSQCLLGNLNVVLGERDLRNSHSLGLYDAGFERWIVHLLVKGRVITTFGIDIVR